MTARTIDGYVLDCITEETVSYASEVTEYPIESGGKIADHLQNDAPVVTFTAVVSDSPIGDAAKARGANVVPSSEAKEFLLGLRAERRPFTFVGTTGTYDLMVFTSLEFPRDNETGKALHIEAELRQLTLAEVKRTVVREVTKLGHRPARTAEGPPLWLCPDLEVVSNDPSANAAKKCRKLVERDGVLHFVDTGEQLTLVEVARANMQRYSRTGGGALDASGNGTLASGKLEWDDKRGWVSRTTYASRGNLRTVDAPLTPRQLDKVKEYEMAEAQKQGLPSGYTVDGRNGDIITNGLRIPDLGIGR